jgi:hypothetical protein
MNDSQYILGPSSSPDTSELTKALAAAQAEYPIVAYDSSNPHFKSKFASYANCCDSLRGPLTKHGLSLPDFRPGMVGGLWVVVGTLRHSSGQWISGVAPLLMGKNDMQSFGAAMTYAKRTLLMALTGGFTGEPDDDGQSLQQESKPTGKRPDSAAMSLVYLQGAINAITQAETEAEAKKHLDTVRLRAKEKAVPVDVYQRCEAAFKETWKQKEAVNG